jgi:lipopolysaccharide/colanic/teichoic acid biosynthesis glycosyltransferase
MIFRQMRVGQSGQQFALLKFRTMSHDAETQRRAIEHLNEHSGVLFKIRRDPRLTPVGRFLRRFSLDELPQLLNVLRGQMSLVGPRPPLPSEVERYGGDVHRRLLVKPGLTGMWQVSGRSDLSWDESVRLDLYYVDHWSVGLDLILLGKTLMTVIRGRGAY